MTRGSVLLPALIAAGAAGLASAPAMSADAGATIGLAVAQSGFMTAYDGDATKSVKLWVDQQNLQPACSANPSSWSKPTQSPTEHRECKNLETHRSAIF
jgi:hypothetical protein